MAAREGAPGGVAAPGALPHIPLGTRGTAGATGTSIEMTWTSITDFGDSAAMLPVAALLFGWLLIDRRVRAASLWAVLFIAQTALVVATKIAFRGWGIGSEALDFTGISGHSMLACSVIPICFLMLTQQAGRAARLLAAGLGLAAGVAIAVSRVELDQHSWSEVIAGCALGGGVTALFAALADRSRAAARLPAPMIAAVLAALLLLIHGTRAPSDALITRMALALSGHQMPYTRYDLHDPWRHGTLGSLAGGDAATPAPVRA